jgi:hypothetical protein
VCSDSKRKNDSCPIMLGKLSVDRHSNCAQQPVLRTISTLRGEATFRKPVSANGGVEIVSLHEERAADAIPARPHTAHERTPI